MAQKTIKKKTGTKTDYLAAVQKIKKESLASVYTLLGEEKFLHEDLIDKIIDQGLDPTTKDFNFDLFYANDTSSDQVVNAASSYPMMAAQRFVIVKDVNQFKASALKHIAEYTKNPAPTTCLILSFPVKSVTDKWGKTVVSNSVSINCRQLYENEIFSWINNYVKSMDMHIEMEAINLLRDQVGNSLLSLVNEVEKIKTNIHPNTRITSADVQEVTSLSKQNTIFELCDAVGEKNMTKALAILNNLLNSQGLSKIKILIVTRLTNHFINLIKIRESIRVQKASKSELTKLTGVNPYFVDKLRKQAQNYSLDQLRQAFIHLENTDLHLKTSYQSPKIALELLLYYLIKNVKIEI